MANDTAPPSEVALAGLLYSSDCDAGFRRVRRGRGFAYVDDEGRRVDDPEVLDRIRALVIPPAWEDVWICATPKGHLQATGRDARGRKQYRYHPAWRRERDNSKFGLLLEFGSALPRIRARVEADLRVGPPAREGVLALIVRLLDESAIRVGNPNSAREFGSFGLTTMRDRHVQRRGSHVVFTFRGKSGKEHCIDMDDPRLARLVMRCRDLPGYQLFQYIDDDGVRQGVESNDVNEYLREISGDAFTAKNFRTWRGTVQALGALRAVGVASSRTAAERNVATAIRQVAEVLGNTPAVCRASYVHPAIIDAYLERALPEQLPSKSKWLSPEERATLALLRSLTQQERAARRKRAA